MAGWEGGGEGKGSREGGGVEVEGGGGTDAGTYRTKVEGDWGSTSERTNSVLPPASETPVQGCAPPLAKQSCPDPESAPAPCSFFFGTAKAAPPARSRHARALEWGALPADDTRHAFAFFARSDTWPIFLLAGTAIIESGKSVKASNIGTPPTHPPSPKKALCGLVVPCTDI